MYKVIKKEDINNAIKGEAKVWKSNKTLPVIEGYMPFLGYKTYFRISGVGNPNKAPLIALHGGPGGGHSTLEILDALAVYDNRQIIMYDQLGCGNSFVEGNDELWNINTWIKELSSLIKYLEIDKYHLLGQSFGGMLELAYATETMDESILSITVSSGLACASLWEKEQRKLIKMLPKNDQDIIYECEKNNDFKNENYLKVVEKFMLLHSCDDFSNNENAPECFRRGKPKGHDHIYNIAWGPNEFNATGTSANLDYTKKLYKIECPVLIINGSEDMCTDNVANSMHKNLPNSKVVKFEGARHRCYYDAFDDYMPVVNNWLNSHE